MDHFRSAAKHRLDDDPTPDDRSAINDLLKRWRDVVHVSAPDSVEAEFTREDYRRFLMRIRTMDLMDTSCTVADLNYFNPIWVDEQYPGQVLLPTPPPRLPVLLQKPVSDNTNPIEFEGRGNLIQPFTINNRVGLDHSPSSDCQTPVDPVLGGCLQEKETIQTRTSGKQRLADL